MREQTVEGWKDFVALADSLDIGEPRRTGYTFRGQSDKGWPLQPSLLRCAPLESAEALIELEKLALSEFRSKAHHHIPIETLSVTNDMFSWWTLMQHHGACTRLLDWTASIFVAAYFAAINDWDKDGAVWVLHINSVNKAMEREFNSFEIGTDTGSFEKAATDPIAPLQLYLIVRKRMSDRMIAQQGGFSVCMNVLGDHADIMQQCMEGLDQRYWYFGKIIIPAALKPTMVRKLVSMNITANSLFPGLDGLAKSVNEFVQLVAASQMDQP